MWKVKTCGCVRVLRRRFLFGQALEWFNYSNVDEWFEAIQGYLQSDSIHE